MGMLRIYTCIGFLLQMSVHILDVYFTYQQYYVCNYEGIYYQEENEF